MTKPWITMLVLLFAGVAVVAVLLGGQGTAEPYERALGDSAAGQGRVAHIPQAVEPLESVVTGPASSRPDAEFGVQPIFVSSTYQQGVAYGPEEDEQGVVQENELTLQTEEMSPDTGLWFSTSATFSTSFAIKRIQSRVANEIYLVGVGRSGEDIIEQWIIAPGQGALAATRPPAATPVGTSVSSSSVVVGVVGGGAFVPPSSRLELPRASKIELYRGGDFGGILDLALDPEGRFVLVLAAGNRSLYRIDLSPPAATVGAPVLVYDTSQIPNLAASLDIYPLQHVSYGRMYILDPDLGSDVVLGPTPLVTSLFDFDNDGVFDAFQSLPMALHKQTYPAGSWVDNFYIY